jgi:nitrate/TMAO reductase-like tetraheme cytochrome c subunit
VTPQHQRPLLHLLASNWISMAGVALVTTAGFSWLFVLPMHIRGHVDNPYIGILVFFAIPAIFFVGLAMIPIGIFFAKRQVRSEWSHAQDRKSLVRRFAVFFAITTFVNILIGSQVTYRAVQHMESVQFCGATCHVMKPELMAHQLPPHEKVACVDCHVVPGAAGFVSSKLSGTRQLLRVISDSYPRPIESAIESNRLAPSAETCENCHDRGKGSGTRVRIIAKYKDDEANTPAYTVLSMKVGGGNFGGIHGAHLANGVRIRYAASDKKRQTIPWVEYTNQSGQKQTYFAADIKPGAVAAVPTFEMQCSDCHSRAAHAFETAERALDEAINHGKVSNSLPFVKKTGLELLSVAYHSEAEAAQKIPAGLTAFYQQKYPDIATKRAKYITESGTAIAAIFAHNVFPDLKVTWATYPNNLGHTDAPGCFRCHDDSHSSADKKKTISQNCASCHEAVAVDDPSPEIFKTLGISGQSN